MVTFFEVKDFGKDVWGLAKSITFSRREKKRDFGVMFWAIGLYLGLVFKPNRTFWGQTIWQHIIAALASLRL